MLLMEGFAMRQPLRILAFVVAMAASFYAAKHRHPTVPPKMGWILPADPAGAANVIDMRAGYLKGFDLSNPAA
jgi:hypothetical protein